MQGGKALALDAWAGREGRACLRFDYGGCGESGGDFAHQTITSWRDDALLMLDRLTDGPVILIGSSMGGWLMLLAALARPERVAGLVGIAAAPDFSRWGFSEADRAELREKGRLLRYSDYGPDPTLTTRALWESGEASLLLEGPIALDCPVRLLHGQRDPDVPFGIALKLAECVRSADVQTLLVKDGDHRLSRDSDIALMLRAVAELSETL